MHTAMTFDGSKIRSEWMLTNPGSREEKFEPWIYFDDEGKKEKREKMNSYNMQRLPAEKYPLKEGASI